MTYVKINGTRYAAGISGHVRDKDWGYRESKAITLEMTYEEAAALFVDDLEWIIVYEADETVEEYNNSEYSVAGAITDNRDGTVTVKMGKPTAEELLAVLVGG